MPKSLYLFKRKKSRTDYSGIWTLDELNYFRETDITFNLSELKHTSYIIQNDIKKIVVSKEVVSNGFFILKFDETTETFIQSQFYPMVYRTMILNDKNELIVQVNDNYTYVFNITTEFSISVDFVNTAPSLDYSGVPFNTDIKVNVFDSIGNRLASTVNLVVENAVFVTSSTTTLSVQTSDTTDTIVSLTVSSAGIVRVTPSL